MTESIIIIGAGIAGLAAGCYGQMNGYRTQICELHDLPGGLCTAWERQGYVFDGCIHYLFGTGPGQPFHEVWEELGALEGRNIVHHDEMMRMVDLATGKTLILYADPDQLEEHLMELSPADKDLIEGFVDGVRQFQRFDMAALQATPKALMGPQEWAALGLKMLPYALAVARWGMMSAKDFAGRFQDPFLRRAIPQMFAWEECPVMAGQSMLASMHNRNGGFPTGGSLEFARAIERRYLELGGQIHYKAQVDRILVEDGRAVGVRLYDDRELRADAVISTADGRGTIFHMLRGEFVDKDLQKRYDGQLPAHTQVQVSLGIDRDLSGEPHWVTYLLEEPITIAGESRDAINVKHYCFDPSLAPPGKSVVEVMLQSTYDYWQRIYGRKLYDTEQIQVCDTVVGFLERLYPGIAEQVEVKDVATPLSYERYTGNWRGSTCGWLLTKDTMLWTIQGVDKTLPGLRNFYMAGQWVEPGGLVPVVAMSGRNAIRMICHDDGRTFIAVKSADR